ncbi:MAG TPA: hypothetical protein VJ821_15640 [Anaerolineales bacterium]|nr:hypothetical protein [Anaerolineales bacterium]
MNSNLRIVLFAHPRSGSTSLHEILQRHPELNILEEPFNENFTRWNPSNKNYRELIHDIPSFDRQLAEIFATYNGIKVLDYQLPDELAIHLLQRPDCKIIFLRRSNLLQSIVSVLIAKQTQLWKKWEMIKPLEDYYRELLPLDVHDVQRRVQALKQQLDFFESVLDALPEGKAIKLTYEGLYFTHLSKRETQLAAVWDFLGVEPLELERIQYYLLPETAKINSKATYALLPNALEIQHRCGNNVTGWLYE